MARILFVQSLHFELLGLMSISALLKEAGHECDLMIGAKGPRVLQSIEKTRPDIVGFPCISGHHRQILSIAHHIKTHGSGRKPLVLIGGPHPTFFPEVINEEPVDIICRGEGEEAILDLMEAMDGKRELPSIANLWVKVNGKIYKNPLRPLIENLDSLPMPDRSLYEQYSYIKNHPVKRFMASRGCPFSCGFCFNQSMRKLYEGLGPYIRRRRVDKVLKEIEEVAQRYPLKRVKFEDDSFTLDREWCLEFARRYKRFNIPFNCYSRADLLDDELIRNLKEAGCERIDFGVETGSEQLRNELLGKGLSDEQIRRASKLIKAHGMKLGTASMLGLPGERLQDALKTVAFNVDIKADDPWCSIFQPYPGTRCGLEAQRLGYCSDLSIDGLSKDYQTTSPLQQKDIKKIINLHKFFFFLVKAPSLSFLIKPLLSLPPNPLFLLIHRLFYLMGVAQRTGGGIRRILLDGWMAMRYK